MLRHGSEHLGDGRCLDLVWAQTICGQKVAVAQSAHLRAVVGEGAIRGGATAFFHDLSCPELNPDRPPPTLIPDWFVKRVNKEFADSQLICADFASNDLFYQTAWQSVSKNLVKKMEDGGPSNKSKIWAKCKKVLVKSLKTFTDAEYEARCKVFTRYFALQREYKNKGVVWSNSLADEAYCVTMMVSGDFMHRVLRSVELVDKATFKVNGKSDGAASGVEVRVHASDVGQDEWYRTRPSTSR